MKITQISPDRQTQLARIRYLLRYFGASDGGVGARARRVSLGAARQGEHYAIYFALRGRTIEISGFPTIRSASEALKDIETLTLFEATRSLVTQLY